MKQRLQTSLGQQLVLTPQLRQALHLLQLSSLELEAEITAAVESNPLLDWVESEPESSRGGGDSPATQADADPRPVGQEPEAAWDGNNSWESHGGSGGSGQDYDDDDGGDAIDRMVEAHSLRDHLAWQLRLSPLSARDVRIGTAIIDAIDDNGYLRETIAGIAETLLPEVVADPGEITTVLRQVQRFDPAGVGARDLGECLCLQLAALPDDTPGKALAQRIASGEIERLPKIGADGLAAELGADPGEVATGLQLVRSLDPRPGAQIGSLSADTYITPDAVIWRHQGVWRVSLAGGQQPRLTIHRGYEAMLGHATGNDAGYLRGRLQEARWLLKNLEARGETLLKVVRCLVRQQSGFLEFGAQALRPLTLREVAAEVELHESTISRAVARKYVRTPRGTLPLRSFFASGIDTEGGGEASSTAIQSMIKRLIDAENPRKPLSDARLAESLKATGVPVARRTVAKYREAMNIPSSHERVRMG